MFLWMEPHVTKTSFCTERGMFSHSLFLSTTLIYWIQYQRLVFILRVRGAGGICMCALSSPLCQTGDYTAHKLLIKGNRKEERINDVHILL